MKTFISVKVSNVQFAGALHLLSEFDFLSTTTIKLEKSTGFCALTVTGWLSDEKEEARFFRELANILVKEPAGLSR